MAKPAGSIITRLAEYLVQARMAPPPAEVVQKAKHHVLDTLAAMVSGSVLEPGALAIKYVRGQGGTPEALVAGTDVLTSAVNAALANGMLAHADETDDSHAASGTHPGCAIVPAALAMAERSGLSGQRFLNAVVLGYDLSSRTVPALGYRDALQEHGFSSHSLGELFGAAAAAGALTELNATQLRYLLSFTVQQASGIPSWARDLDHIEKAFDFGGMPARNGVASATMVDAGFTGVDDVFQGDWNFFRSFSRAADPEKMVDGLGTRFEILNTNIKKYCVGSPIQAALDALFNITATHPVRPDDVEKMVVTLGVTGARTVNDRNMPDINLQYILATTLIDGDLSFERAHDYAHMTDPAVLDLRRKIELRGDNALVTAESPRQAVVEVHTTDGRHYRDHVVKVRGTAENPMSAEEVENKARDLVEPIVGRDATEQLVSTVARLEAVRDVRELRPLLQPSSR